MSLERIIITFKKNGTLRGVSSTDFDGLPIPLTIEQLTALSGVIDTATIAALGEKDVALLDAKAAKSAAESAKEVAEQKHAELIAVAESEDIEAIKAKTREQKLSKKEREIAEIEKQIAELERQKAEKQSAEAAHTIKVKP